MSKDNYGKCGERTNVTLPVDVKKKAKKIGEGNMSEGIRKAVKEYKK